MKVRVIGEDIREIELYYNEYGGVYGIRNNLFPAEACFYDFDTPCLKIRFESKKELEDFIETLNKLKEYLEENNINEFVQNKIKNFNEKVDQEKESMKWIK